MDKSEIEKFSTGAGIYMFTNNINGKHYIGQSVNLRERIKAHIRACNYPEKYSCLLYKAISKYGIENFTICILCECSMEDKLKLKEELDRLEKAYIEKYQSYGEYNKTVGGDCGVLGLKMTQNQKSKIREAVQKRVIDGRFTVYIYDTYTKVYMKYKNMQQASQDLDCKFSSLRSAKSHKYLFMKRYIVGSSVEEVEEIYRQKCK